MKARRILIPTFVLLLLSALGVQAAEIPPSWKTVAETHDFRRSSSYAETVDFLRRADAASPMMRLEFFGTSACGRQLPLLIVSKDGLFSPEAARKAGADVILIQSCIHAGEAAGKTASEMLIRDLVLGRQPDLPDAGVILFIPIYNADGHERVSRFNRANQNGPVDGMGFRTTARGLDLNRDHLKLESREARALIALVNRWQPDLHVDNHVTDGSRHHWILTLSNAEAPQLAAPLSDWLHLHLSRVKASLGKAGVANGPYVALLDGADPTKGINSSVAAPRYSTGYFTLRNTISILVEMYAHAPFRERVTANYDFLVALLREIAGNPAALHQAVQQANTEETARGRAKQDERDEIVLRWKTADAAEKISFPVCPWTREISTATGRPFARYHCGEDDPPIEVPWYHRPEAEILLPRPAGYLLQPGWPQIEEKLRAHGLRIFKLAEGLEGKFESIRVSDARLAERSYQGRVAVVDFLAERGTETLVFPRGSLWIPADQPHFEIAVQLLEPEAPDSLLRWGFLDSVFERKEYIGSAELEDLIGEMLKDPETVHQWETAKEELDANARYLWWYARTPYWDRSIGLLPYARVMERPAEMQLENGHRD